MKTLTTVTGDKVSVRERELIWNALDYLRMCLSDADDFFLALYPRREGIDVPAEELISFINSVSRKYA